MIVTPLEVKSRLDAGEQLYLIDVREPHEFSRASIAGAELIPMKTIPDALERLRGASGSIVVFCHHGMRSLNVVQWLRQRGVANCASMEGGIDQWSREVDRAVPRYR
jgi:rhodanese-related sulfurtransferase